MAISAMLPTDTQDHHRYLDPAVGALPITSPV